MEPETLNTMRHWLLAVTMLIPRPAAAFAVIPFLGRLLHGQLRNSVIIGIWLIMMPIMLPAVPPLK